MTRSIALSLVFHSVMIILTAISLPFMMRTPVDLPPILSVDLIQITDTTSIPFAAKAAKTLEKIKRSKKLNLSQRSPNQRPLKRKVGDHRSIGIEMKNMSTSSLNPSSVI